jgi:transposase|tara:strand:+ start:318 stop:1499 length:1182 start_codon:yes stop_codon:yes gene_type:complete
MGRTEVLQGIRLMKFEEVYERSLGRRLSQSEAALVLGVSERTFRRWRDRFEAEGAEGLYDRRLGKVSARRVAVDTVMEVLELFDTRYWDFTAKHFWEKLVEEHGFTRSYNWVRLMLQAHGRKRAAPRRGAHRRKRPRRALPGMMVHQDGSTHEWVPGQWWDLIVTMDDATSETYSAFFVEEEGTLSTFTALAEVIAEKGLFCALYADRAGHYWHTPEAGGKVDKDNPTQVGQALAQLGIELIAAYSPEARGRSERMFGTLQKRLPQELRLHGITTMAEANRFLKEDYLPRHNTRFAVPPEGEGSAFVPFAGALEDILCVQEERVVGNDNTVRYKNRVLQIPEDRHRHHYVKVRVRVHEYPNGTLAVFHGPRRLAVYDADGTAVDTTKEDKAAA